MSTAETVFWIVMAAVVAIDLALTVISVRLRSRLLKAAQDNSAERMAVLEKYMTHGQILEHTFGVQDASKDSRSAYVRDPFWFQWQIMRAEEERRNTDLKAQGGVVEPLDAPSYWRQINLSVGDGWQHDGADTALSGLRFHGYRIEKAGSEREGSVTLTITRETEAN